MNHTTTDNSWKATDLLYPFVFMCLGVVYIYLGVTSWTNGFGLFALIFGLGGLGIYALGLLGMISGLFNWVRHRFELEDQAANTLNPRPEYKGLQLKAEEAPTFGNPGSGPVTG
ncbi:MAG: hypothetical protein AAF514_20085 [Verrucomicrobiota bacterium]